MDIWQDHGDVNLTLPYDRQLFLVGESHLTMVWLSKQCQAWQHIGTTDPLEALNASCTSVGRTLFWLCNVLLDIMHIC